jgi:hypothetical protein
VPDIGEVVRGSCLRAMANNTLQRTGGTAVVPSAVVKSYVWGHAAPAAEHGRSALYSFL